MPFTRRNFLKTFTLVTSNSAVMATGVDVLTPTPDEQKMIGYMQDHGITHFTLLNKKRGQILFIEDGHITRAESALSGKFKGDTARNDFGATPSGIHILRSFGNGTHIGFKQVDERTDYSIHTLVNPAGQNRPARLASASAAFKRVSSGCVNVSQSTLTALLDFMEISNQIFRDDDKKPYVMGSFFIVLPETKPVQSIFKYPEFSIPSAR